MPVEKIPEEKYRKLDFMSQTRLKQLLNMTPMQWKDYEFKETVYTLTGTLAHGIALEGMNHFDSLYAIDRWPSETGKQRRGNEYQDYKKGLEDSDKPYMKEEDLKNALAMARAFHERWGSSKFMKSGVPELACWDVELFGIKSKGLFDFVPDNYPIIADLKTTSKDLDDKSIHYQLLDGWAFQAAYYSQLWEKEIGERRSFVFLVVNSKSMMTRAVKVGINSEYMQLGYDQVQEATEIYKNCLLTGVYPGYENFDYNELWKGWKK
jgi:hypothetical protein